MLWREPTDGSPFDSPLPAPPQSSSDTMGLIGKLSELLDDSVSRYFLQLVLSDQLESRYRSAELPAMFPGQVFGPTTLPPGQGTSTEIVVDHADVGRALSAIYAALAMGAGSGTLLLGALGIRFVGQSNALLGMNIHPMNVYIELPSVRNDEVEQLYTLCWDALENADVPFTCHWGQRHGMTRARLERYFGARVERWTAARARLLPSADARAVFASPLLADVGID